MTAEGPLGTASLLPPLREILTGEDFYRDGAKGVSNLWVQRLLPGSPGADTPISEHQHVRTKAVATYLLNC